MVTDRVLPSEMICHLHILVMSEELATGVDLYTLIAWVEFSEIGTELDIMEPCYEEPINHIILTEIIRLNIPESNV